MLTTISKTDERERYTWSLYSVSADRDEHYTRETVRDYTMRSMSEIEY
jgi:hypothetical protein